MAMGAVKGQAATLQVEMVCLDELVPEDDRYRKLDRLVDWSFVRDVAAPYYAHDVGRPSIDPIVLVKLMVAGALEGIGSTRELLREAGMRLDLRRFLGYGLGERLPVHQTFSHAHTRRFVDAALFERLFLRSGELCKQHGLVEGTHISIEGFHAEADAALKSLRASLALAPAEEAETAEDSDGVGRARRGRTASSRSASRPATPPRMRLRCSRWPSRARAQRRSARARIGPPSR
jgi:transposase